MSGKGEGDRPVHADRPSRRDGPRVGREKEREEEKRERLGQDERKENEEDIGLPRVEEKKREEANSSLA